MTKFSQHSYRWLGNFSKGTPVILKEPLEDGTFLVGHVISFINNTRSESSLGIDILVHWANGTEYQIPPEELDALN